MSLKRFVGVCVILVVLFSAAPVLADSAYYTCYVHQVGMISPCTTYPNGAVQFALFEQSGAFSNSFYVTDNDTRKMFLSIALTAISTERMVVGYLDPTDNTSLVELYIRMCGYGTNCQ